MGKDHTDKSRQIDNESGTAADKAEQLYGDRTCLTFTWKPLTQQKHYFQYPKT